MLTMEREGFLINDTLWAVNSTVCIPGPDTTPETFWGSMSSLRRKPGN